MTAILDQIIRALTVEELEPFSWSVPIWYHLPVLHALSWALQISWEVRLTKPSAECSLTLLAEERCWRTKLFAERLAHFLADLGSLQSLGKIREFRNALGTALIAYLNSASSAAREQHSPLLRTSPKNVPHLPHLMFHISWVGNFPLLLEGGWPLECSNPVKRPAGGQGGEAP